MLRKPVGIAGSVDSLVMVPHYLCDLRVVIDLRDDPLPNRGMLFHLPPLFQSERPCLLEQSRRKSDLSDIVHESTEVGETLVLFVQAKAARDISRVSGDRCGMASRIPISRVQRRHKCAGERQMRLLLAQ